MDETTYVLAGISFLFGLTIGWTLRMRTEADRREEEIQRQLVLQKLGVLMQAYERLSMVADRGGQTFDGKKMEA